MSHTFHIPVLGLGYTIDTPLKVARYGISSVMSIVDDELVERMREYHALQNGLPNQQIAKGEPDHRAKRITAYLDLIDGLVTNDFNELRTQQFAPGTDLTRYFELLPESSQLKQGYDLMMEYPEGYGKTIFQNILRQNLQKGSIDVNIMAKVDKMNFDSNGNYLGDDNTDALAALKGFAESTITGSIVLSAGMNPRLYSYIERFQGFYPDANGSIKKRIILKVSDFRSALIQAKFLAKKGLWVSEFRIESGLNCGGHAFATEGYLLGPILEEFKQQRAALRAELTSIFSNAIKAKGREVSDIPSQRITVQGGIGTAEENEFLIRYYQLDGTGWGSPFLLVPEATNVDEETLLKLTKADANDFYLSNASPLGILFNNFKGSSINTQIQQRITNNRPGSPCTKKFLVSNTEFTDEPICTASREYQHHKIKQLDTLNLSIEDYTEQFNAITEKACLCEGLCTSAYLKYGIVKEKENTAVAICPGPNLAYFKSLFSLDEMVGHIYGKVNLLEGIKRPNLFIKELQLYVEYLQADVQKSLVALNDKKRAQLGKFREQLLKGIVYYRELFNNLGTATSEIKDALKKFEAALSQDTLIIA